MAEGSPPPPRTLFLQEDGSPLHFYLPPGPWKRRLQPLILAGGGVLCRMREPGALLLAPPGAQLARTESYLSARYVPDCVRAARCLEPDAYRLPAAPCCAHQLPPPGGPGRNAFTRTEDLAILLYLRQHAGGARASGTALWREMGRLQLTRHPWQAMRDRYLKRLRGREAHYQLQARTNIPTLVYPSCGGCRRAGDGGGRGEDEEEQGEEAPQEEQAGEGPQEEQGGEWPQEEQGGEGPQDEQKGGEWSQEEQKGGEGPEEQSTRDFRRQATLGTEKKGPQTTTRGPMVTEGGNTGGQEALGVACGPGRLRERADGSTCTSEDPSHLRDSTLPQDGQADRIEVLSVPEQYSVACSGEAEVKGRTAPENGAALQGGTIKPPGVSWKQGGGRTLAGSGTVRSSRSSNDMGGWGNLGTVKSYRTMTMAFQEAFRATDSIATTAHEGGSNEAHCAVATNLGAIGSQLEDLDGSEHGTKALQEKLNEDLLVEDERTHTNDLSEEGKGNPVVFILDPLKSQNKESTAKPPKDGITRKSQNDESRDKDPRNATPKSPNAETGSNVPRSGSPRKRHIATNSSNAPKNGTPEKQRITAIRTNAPSDETPQKEQNVENRTKYPRNESPVKEHNAESKDNSSTDGTQRKQQNEGIRANALQDGTQKEQNAETRADVPEDGSTRKEIETLEDMRTRNNDRVKIKLGKKKAPASEPEDLEDSEDLRIKRRKKDTPMIRLEELSSSEEDEIQIKRRMKASPASEDLSIFERASQEFESEDDTPELEPSISYGKSRLCLRSPELPSCKQILGLKPYVSSVDFRVTALEGSPKKKEECTRNPELQVCRDASGLKHFVCSEDSLAGESQNQIEAVPSSPSASQTEIDNATKYFQSLMEEFGLSLSTVTQAFLKNSGELEATQYFLKNSVRPDGYPIWTKQDDVDLKTGNEKLRLKLIAKFGTDNVAKRIVFLRS